MQSINYSEHQSANQAINESDSQSLSWYVEGLISDSSPRVKKYPHLPWAAMILWSCFLMKWSVSINDMTYYRLKVRTGKNLNLRAGC